MKKIGLHWQILIAMVLGFVFGAFVPELAKYIDWVGKLFLNALNMIVVPLVFSSIIMGILSLSNINNLKRLGLKTMLLYVFSMLLAIIVGLLLVNIIRPGDGVGLEIKQDISSLNIGNNLSFKDTLLNIVPTNILYALSNNNMLAVIFLALLFGIFINKSKAQTKNVMVKFFDALYDISITITNFIIRLAPYGVFAILVSQISKTDDVLSLLGNLGKYMITVATGLLFHLFVTLSLMVWIIAKVNPFKHLKNMFSVLLTAFSTASSSATLPLTIEAVQDRDGVSPQIASITLPLGATINMNGTALLECVAVIFIAQAYGIELSFIQQIIVVFTALLAAIGTAGIPMVGLVMMSVILNAVGLPIEGIGLVIGVDRILDMMRTAVNVYGDTCVAVIVAKSEGEKLNID